MDRFKALQLESEVAMDRLYGYMADRIAAEVAKLPDPTAPVDERTMNRLVATVLDDIWGTTPDATLDSLMGREQQFWIRKARMSPVQEYTEELQATIGPGRTARLLRLARQHGDLYRTRRR